MRYKKPLLYLLLITKRASVLEGLQIYYGPTVSTKVLAGFAHFVCSDVCFLYTRYVFWSVFLLLFPFSMFAFFSLFFLKYRAFFFFTI